VHLTVDWPGNVNPHTLQCLRVTLDHLEQTTGALVAPEDLTALQRILLKRIAELEAIREREAALVNRVDPH
jgi:hypothetical protein